MSYFQSSSIVYKFKYQCEAEYIGRTNQWLETRISQHIPASIRLGSLSLSSRVTRSVHDSAIGEQLLDNPDCAYKYMNNSLTVLHRAHSAYDLHIEVLHIKLHQLTPCKQKEHFICFLNLLGRLSVLSYHFILGTIYFLFVSFFYQ